ncbi:MAG: hypothetical protein QOJ91_399 [Sphingomonadales bacterium]|jgi:hypothetical protein|nr:hypothetical protein [Sphingomonadales bacterium]
MTSADWKGQRKAGIAAIAAASVVAAALWLGIRFLAPPLAGMESLGDRMLVALYGCCFATLFCLVTGIEAVAHERLQSPAFDPLAGYRSRRLEVNQRYLQNTLEQLAVFVPGLFGLAAYSPDGGSMRAVVATTMVWILARLAFWIGYHRSAAMRGLGAPGMMVGMLVLLYVVFRIACDAGGLAAGIGAMAAFGAFEAVLFWGTRARVEEGAAG